MFHNMGETWSESAGEIIIMLVIAFALGYLVKVFSGNEKEEINRLEDELSILQLQKLKLKRKLKRLEENQKSLLPKESFSPIEEIKNPSNSIDDSDPKLGNSEEEK